MSTETGNVRRSPVTWQEPSGRPHVDWGAGSSFGGHMLDTLSKSRALHEIPARTLAPLFCWTKEEQTAFDMGEFEIPSRPSARVQEEARLRAALASANKKTRLLTALSLLSLVANVALLAHLMRAPEPTSTVKRAPVNEELWRAFFRGLADTHLNGGEPPLPSEGALGSVIERTPSPASSENPVLPLAIALSQASFSILADAGTTASAEGPPVDRGETKVAEEGGKAVLTGSAAVTAVQNLVAVMAAAAASVQVAAPPGVAAGAAPAPSGATSAGLNLPSEPAPPALLVQAVPVLVPLDPGSEVRLHVSGLRGNLGTVRCYLFNAPGAGFPYNLRTAFRQIADPNPQQGKRSLQYQEANCSFADVPPGKYAIAAYHDENSDSRWNNDLFGSPSEGLAVSADNIPAHPDFSNSSFDYKGGTLQMNATMKYP